MIYLVKKKTKATNSYIFRESIKTNVALLWIYLGKSYNWLVVIDVRLMVSAHKQKLLYT